MNAGQRARLRLPALGLAAAVALAWIGVFEAARIPLLSLVDVGVDGLGKLVTAPFSPLVRAMAGPVAVLTVPLALAGYFLLGWRDWVGVGLCLVWAGSAARGVAVAIADAPFGASVQQAGERGWTFILGSTGRLDRAADLAADVTAAATVLAVAGIAACAWALLGAWMSILSTDPVSVGRER